MNRIGLIAGSGNLPFEFARSAKEQGEHVVIFAIKDVASPALKDIADKIYWLDVGQYKKFLFLLLAERVRHVALIGKVDKNLIYREGTHDEEYTTALKNLDNKKDYSILEEITRHLGRIGIQVVDGTKYLAHLLPEKGILGKEIPEENVEEDILFGYDIAKKLAGMDIGQTVVVKDKTVVAVEAMEGTDETISRSGKTAGKGCVMIKVSRPDQDGRWDVPTVGPDTMTALSENGFKALAIESGKMYLVDKQQLIDIADSSGIIVKAL